MKPYINIADLRDPDDPQGRSYREVNAAQPHSIPVGSLVELESGVRLFVVWRGRDCDQTPLYWLSPNKDDSVKHREGFVNHGWHGGYAEQDLTVVQPLTLPSDQQVEAVLRAHGMSGKEVINGFIERLLRERLAFEDAIKNFVRDRGHHEGEHVFDLNVCSRCDQSYVRAEEALSRAVNVLTSDIRDGG